MANTGFSRGLAVGGGFNVSGSTSCVCGGTLRVGTDALGASVESCDNTACALHPPHTPMPDLTSPVKYARPKRSNS